MARKSGRRSLKFAAAESPDKTPPSTSRDAKLHVEDKQQSSVTAAPTEVPELASEEQWVVGRRTTTPPPPDAELVSDSHTKPPSGTATVPVICPLCFAQEVTDPVLLHPVDAASKACVACRVCVTRWTSLLQLQKVIQPSAAPKLPCPLCTSTSFALGDVPHSSEASKTVADTSPASLQNIAVTAEWSLAQRGEAEVCGVCEEHRATHHCVQCDFPICSSCQEATHAKGRFRLHEMIPIGGARQRQFFKCRAHPAQRLDLYCKTCASCICVLCCFGEGAHRGHDVVPLADIAASTRARMKTTLGGLQQTADQANNEHHDLRACAPSFQADVHAAEEEIHRSFAALREALSQREAALVQQLQRNARQVVEELSSSAAASATLAAELQHAQERFNLCTAALDSAALMRHAGPLERCYKRWYETARRPLQAAVQIKQQWQCHVQRLSSIEGSCPRGHAVHFSLSSASVKCGGGGADHPSLDAYLATFCHLGSLQMPSSVADVIMAPASHPVQSTTSPSEKEVRQGQGNGNKKVPPTKSGVSSSNEGRAPLASLEISVRPTEVHRAVAAHTMGPQRLYPGTPPSLADSMIDLRGGDSWPPTESTALSETELFVSAAARQKLSLDSSSITSPLRKRVRRSSSAGRFTSPAKKALREGLLPSGPTPSLNHAHHLALPPVLKSNIGGDGGSKDEKNKRAGGLNLQLRF